MRRSVTGKLTLIITSALVLIFGAATVANLKIQERGATRILRLNGEQLADMVAAATRTAMLQNDRRGLRATLDTLARQRDIERIRIIEKAGRIAHSTDPSEIGTVLDAREEQCVVCHPNGDLTRASSEKLGTRLVRRGGHRVLGVTRAIPNEPDCSNAACHVHSPSDSMLGMLDVNLALGPYDRARMASAAEMLAASLIGILLVVGITVGTVRRIVHRPVRNLILEAERIASGDLSARVPEMGDDEIGALAKTFNRMARDLEAAHAKLLEWGRTLEDRVREKTEELKRAQDQILQVEKMASLGKLAAVVAHEINNPLFSVVTYAKILVRRLRAREVAEERRENRENLEYLESIASEAARCGEIVTQLLAFARRGGGTFAPTDVNQVVERALFLVHHQFELSGVKVRTKLAPHPGEILADASQIQQALMALFINASQAMERGGDVRVSTRRVSGGAEIEVADTGPGMPPEVARHAFEPFFTTKEEGSGVGLGLSVVYGIVERHGGRVDLDTAPEKGCRFTLFFPERPPRAEESEETA